MCRSNSSKRLHSLETLESRRVFAAVPWGGSQVAEEAPQETETVAVAGSQPAEQQEVAAVLLENLATVRNQDPSFEGNPSRPIVSGRIYQEAEIPSFGLPHARQISGMRSNSTFSVGDNELISVDDATRDELIRIHAQYDMASTIEHDDAGQKSARSTREITIDKMFAREFFATHTIGGLQSISIGAAQEITVGGFR